MSASNYIIIYNIVDNCKYSWISFKLRSMVKICKRKWIKGSCWVSSARVRIDTVKDCLFLRFKNIFKKV
jgi:hypothetical protein